MEGYIEKSERKNILFLADDCRLPSGIGTMTRNRWETFFTLMAQNGLYDMEMNWESAFTTKFVTKADSE